MILWDIMTSFLIVMASPPSDRGTNDHFRPNFQQQTSRSYSAGLEKVPLCLGYTVWHLAQTEDITPIYKDTHTIPPPPPIFVRSSSRLQNGTAVIRKRNNCVHSFISTSFPALQRFCWFTTPHSIPPELQSQDSPGVSAE